MEIKGVCPGGFVYVDMITSATGIIAVLNSRPVITQGYVRVTNKFARLYFLSFHLLCVIVVLK